MPLREASPREACGVEGLSVKDHALTFQPDFPAVREGEGVGRPGRRGGIF